MRFENWFATKTTSEDGIWVESKANTANVVDRFRPRVAIKAMFDIHPDQELLLCYGPKQAPRPCHCIQCSYNAKAGPGKWSDLS